ncbi:MAG: DMT family transporter [Gammaproteobacteria bacterium]|nr:DMT family transporter [Gammaproteobacteria bacterium]
MTLRSVLYGLLFVFFWSSAFTSARMIVEDAPPVTALAVRFFLMGVIAVGIAKWQGQSWHLTPAQWKSTLIFGVCQNALYLGLNFYAMQTVEASLASIIASSMPLLVALIGWVFWRDRIKPLGQLGLVLGLVGVGIIMGYRMESGVDVQGVLLCAIAALALAVATLSVRGASTGGNVLMIVGLQGFVGAMVLAVVAFFTETFEVNWTLQLGLAFSYTLIFPGLVATWIWFNLVNDIGALRASTFHFLNPFFGVTVAAILLDEQMALTDWVGVFVVMAGILAVQLSKQR